MASSRSGRRCRVAPITARSLPRQQQLARPVQIGLDRVFAAVQLQRHRPDRMVLEVVELDELPLVMRELGFRRGLRRLEA